VNGPARIPKSRALRKINVTQFPIVNKASTGSGAETRFHQALIEAVPGSEEHLMPTRSDRIFIPIRGRVMNAENSHGAKVPSLNRLYLF
jgi:hypothetical protein